MFALFPLFSYSELKWFYEGLCTSSGMNTCFHSFRVYARSAAALTSGGSMFKLLRTSRQTSRALSHPACVRAAASPIPRGPDHS